jgi:uncharacterized protein YraI
MPRTFLACAALAAALSLPGLPAGAQPVQGRIVGAESVNIRRGPGTESPAFVALPRGATVRVDERSGQWARVTLENGVSGYVNVAFVEVASGATIPVAAETTPIDAGSTPPSGEPTATVGVAAPPAIDRELADLRSRLASLEASLEPAGGASPTPTSTPAIAIDGEVVPPLPPVVEPPATLDVGPSLALAGVGFVVGFLFGTFYGQRQERNRRTRVRF